MSTSSVSPRLFLVFHVFFFRLSWGFKLQQTMFVSLSKWISSGMKHHLHQVCTLEKTAKVNKILHKITHKFYVYSTSKKKRGILNVPYYAKRIRTECYDIEIFVFFFIFLCLVASHVVFYTLSCYSLLGLSYIKHFDCTVLANKPFPSIDFTYMRYYFVCTIHKMSAICIQGNAHKIHRNFQQISSKLSQLLISFVWETEKVLFKRNGHKEETWLGLCCTNYEYMLYIIFCIPFSYNINDRCIYPYTLKIFMQNYITGILLPIVFVDGFIQLHSISISINLIPWSTIVSTLLNHWYDTWDIYEIWTCVEAL